MSAWYSCSRAQQYLPTAYCISCTVPTQWSLLVLAARCCHWQCSQVNTQEMQLWSCISPLASQRHLLCKHRIKQRHWFPVWSVQPLHDLRSWYGDNTAAVRVCSIYTKASLHDKVSAAYGVHMVSVCASTSAYDHHSNCDTDA